MVGRKIPQEHAVYLRFVLNINLFSNREDSRALVVFCLLYIINIVIYFCCNNYIILEIDLWAKH